MRGRRCNRSVEFHPGPETSERSGDLSAGIRFTSSGPTQNIGQVFRLLKKIISNKRAHDCCAPKSRRQLDPYSRALKACSKGGGLCNPGNPRARSWAFYNVVATLFPILINRFTDVLRFLRSLTSALADVCNPDIEPAIDRAARLVFYTFADGFCRAWLKLVL